MNTTVKQESYLIEDSRKNSANTFQNVTATTIPSAQTKRIAYGLATNLFTSFDHRLDSEQ